MIEIAILLLVGALSSLCGAVVGLGGGFIIVPFLAFAYDMPVSQIVGTSLAVLVFGSLSSTIAYLKQKRIDIKSGILFAVAMVPGSILGAFTANVVSNQAFFIALGIFLLGMALFLLKKPQKSKSHLLKPTVERTFSDSSGVTHTYSFNMKFGVIIALAVGFISSLFGIGGGSVMVPTMVMLLSFPAHIAAATSMLSILISATTGSIAHLALGHIDFVKMLWLAIGSLIGSQIGAKIASKLPGQLILRFLSIALIFVAIRLMFKS
ncbi:sulfite exporter TauE/SafE family protein [Neobacillus mesonae]|nr:sulfite exporter TauE/SafE family protein [Neobacillus mesonae]